MIKLDKLNVELSADLSVKQAAANKQMKELVERLSQAPKYHTLTKQDRQVLSKEGYAPDLANNLVLITQRDGSTRSSAQDTLQVGFTYAAFDPALYASRDVHTALERLSHCCCCYCESFLMPTGAGEVGHFRPVTLLDTDASQSSEKRHSCSPYYLHAYDQSNLVYSCPECNSDQKAGQFPIVGERNAQDVTQEKPLLVNPYQEDPRDYIRFNPHNGHAYAFDQVCRFYQAKHDRTPAQVEVLMWQKPASIPNQFTTSGELLTDSQTQQQYEDWRAHNDKPSKGEQTIRVLGLNRTPLVLARLAMANSLMAGYKAHQQAAPVKTDAKGAKAGGQNDSIAYRSMTIDIIQTLNQARSSSLNTETSKSGRQNTAPAGKPHRKATNQQTAKPDAVNKQSVSEEDGQVKVSNALASQVLASKAVSSKEPQTIATWLRSCLSYLVLESELTQTNKRRLVCLSAEDKVYGGTDTEKCVFLPIDWKRDLHNVIKVKSNRNIWEASFLELAHSRPHELINLFANNDVWVEGEFSPLA
ncbi:hypothetical protein [Vibrio coralliilyticus]|uniref:hypothetical protein n=1 Tax=Vibrio coralliilyticus TaxID=190893 RepID=UPI00148B666F|nr:hypothetical protein [Vibrio coralliilyticus]NOI28127.1 hypothetical protein [Vibrio coralliilyticus]NOI49068.1 hypothetical protein [Vibrio coralliilyticus]